VFFTNCIGANPINFNQNMFSALDLLGREEVFMPFSLILLEKNLKIRYLLIAIVNGQSVQTARLTINN
jgi:hypothetical protein